MSPGTAFWKWSAIGGVVAGILLFAQVNAVGGSAGLLQVGEASALRPVIEAELGDIPLAAGPGHDGQIYYAIALDLGGGVVPELLDHGAYRYRRILYPLLASLGGLLDGTPLLYSMMGLTVIAAAAAAGGVAALAVGHERPEWLALSVVLNPGVWVSVRLLTADTVALALMVLGLLWLARRRPIRSACAFALSVLAKDVYLATPAGIAVSRDRRRWAGLAVSVAALVIWMTWLTATMGEGFTGRGNLTLPFMGMVDASPVWAGFDAAEWGYLIFALMSVAVGLVSSVLRASWLRWSILAWSGLGVVSSNWVWDFGNNAVRAFAPIVVLLALSYVPVPARVGGDGVEGSPAL